ncbi:hypothetical protein BDY24DRAFT_375979 [Mrakia frigida]|uniref:uncharacterized protein n=1 Tax=Mrakia frigida TaxID=29902 RepID=UPI003FCC0413
MFSLSFPLPLLPLLQLDHFYRFLAINTPFTPLSHYLLGRPRSLALLAISISSVASRSSAPGRLPLALFRASFDSQSFTCLSSTTSSKSSLPVRSQSPPPPRSPRKFIRHSNPRKKRASNRIGNQPLPD